MKRILLVDDHQIVRDGIKNLLESTGEYLVVGEAVNVSDALNLLEKLLPDLLVTDISLANSNGIELTRKVKQIYSDIPVLVLSMHDTEEYINLSFESGASGYLLKDCTKDEMLTAISRISNGEMFVSKSASQVLVNKMLNKTPQAQPAEPEPAEQEAGPALTKREREILDLVYEGLSNKEIAAKLFLSVRTIDTHRYNILQKFKARNTADLINKAVKAGLISRKK